MYKILLSFFILVTLSATSKAEISIFYKMRDCDQVRNLFIFEFNGINFKQVGLLQKQDSVSYVGTLPTTEPRFYYIGKSPQQVAPIILGSESKVVVQANCNQYKNIQIIESDLNVAYRTISNEMGQINNQMSQAIRSYRSAAKDSTKLAAAIEQFARIDSEKNALLSSARKQNDYLGDIVALNTYLSFHNNGEGYQNEQDYFANEYFQHVDWKNKNYHYMSWVYEAVRSYTSTVSLFGFPDEIHKNLLEELLNNIPENTRTKQLALAGIISGLQSRKHSNMAYFAQKFVDTYKDTAPLAVKAMEKELASTQAFIIGAEAPNFEQQTPDGTSIQLSDLRGQIVLVDFWASWCGPCRRENPNVVKVYEKYKEKGFEILGVSLDKDKARWLGAIEADKLAWQHVSDLKGWSNEVAQLYGVRGIPDTVLVDKEGKIIARNLRGNALEAKLEEIFGE